MKHKVWLPNLLFCHSHLVRELLEEGQGPGMRGSRMPSAGGEALLLGVGRVRRTLGS